MLILWAFLFFIVAIGTSILAFGGVAIAISFFAKILFLISLICFVIFCGLLVAQKISVKNKKEDY